ncbi:MAG: M28 family metallopeptidase [Gemmatimonadota bacterium]
MPFDIEAARAALQEVRRHDAASLRQRIQDLARPRLTGSEGATETEARLREAFESLGYRVAELPFRFSTWPGRWGLPASGILLALTGAGGAALIHAGAPIRALAVLAVGMALTLLPLLVLGPSLRALPAGQVDARNLLFTRDGTRPSWLVMAHRDTKSQLVPTLGRTAAIVAGIVGWLGLVALAGLWFAGEPFRPPAATLVAGGVTVLAGLVLGLAWASDASPGALDNASGLAALLAVAEERPAGVAFLVTDGEELGLAGARAVVDRLPPVQGVINVDGLDDRGAVRVAEGYGWRRRGSAPQLAAALLTAGRVLEIPVERRPLPRSIMVDHAPLAAAGIPSLTVLRGDWRSLLRVHRPVDTAERLNGRGAAQAATLLSAAFTLLREEHAPHLAADRGPAP